MVVAAITRPSGVRSSGKITLGQVGGGGEMRWAGVEIRWKRLYGVNDYAE